MEGPLVSDTTELLNGAPGASGDAPVGTPPPAGAASAGAGGATAPASRSRSRRGTGLSSKVMPELQQIAQGLGIPGAGRMRKPQLIEAMEARQGGAPPQNAGTTSGGSEKRAGSAGAGSTRLGSRAPWNQTPAA